MELTPYQLKKLPLFVHVNYTLIKIRLVIHAANMYRFYMFLMGLNQTPDHNVVQNRLAGNKDVLRVIRGYILDPIHLPSSKFAVRGLNELSRQVNMLLHSGEQKNERVWKALLNSDPLLCQPPPILVEETPNSAAECYTILDGHRKSWHANRDCAGALYTYVMTIHPDTGLNYDARMR
jgi:hypothetical protein